MPKTGWADRQNVFVTNAVELVPTQSVNLNDGSGTGITSTTVGSDEALDVNVVSTTGTVVTTVTEALTITAHDLNAAQYSTATSLTTDSIVDSLVLYFSGAAISIDITLEDSDSGGQIVQYTLNKNTTSFAALNINYALDSARNVLLTIGQTAGACTVTGALFVRE